MGYIAHDAVIVTVSNYKPELMPDVSAFIESMPEEFRHLVVGPIGSAVNSFVTWFFAPDGSKEFWDTSDLGDGWRRKFIDLFRFAYEDGSSPFDVVSVRFGGDFGCEFDGPIAVDPTEADPEP
jgi:hypothetical protein